MTVLLAAAAFVVALFAVVWLTVVHCETQPRPGRPREDLCNAPYQLLVIPPPLVVVAGALVTFRDRRYVGLVAGIVAAAALIGMIFVLPDLYPT